MRIPGIRIECLIAILRQNAYMHEQITQDLVYALGTGSTSMSIRLLEV